MTARGILYPLLSTQRHLIAGRDFVALVEGLCRVGVQSDEEGAWWVLGVEPGGIAEQGDAPQDAYLRFKEAFRDVLSDLADRASDFDAFAESVRKFVHEVNRPTEAEWLAASEAFRNGTLVPEPPFAKLPKKSAATPCYVNIHRQGTRPTFEKVDTGVDKPALARAA